MKNFYTMDINELVRDYEDITKRMTKVNNAAYFKMLPAKNAMFKALEKRGYFKKAHNKATAPKNNAVWFDPSMPCYYTILQHGMH